MVGLYEYLLLGGAIQRWQKDTDNYKASYCFVKIVDPIILLENFNKVILVASNIKTTLVGLVWSNIFKVNFMDYPDITLRSPVLPNTNKITIYPMLKDANLSKYLLEKPDKDGILFDTVLRKALSLVEGDPFMYVVNNYRDVTLKGSKVPVQSHGLNNYSHISNSICLFSYNPDNFTRYILEDLAEHFKLPKDLFVQGYITSNYMESTFQNATRGSIRNHSCNKKVKIIVGDLRCAGS